MVDFIESVDFSLLNESLLCFLPMKFKKDLELLINCGGLLEDELSRS